MFQLPASVDCNLLQAEKLVALTNFKTLSSVHFGESPHTSPTHIKTAN